MGIFKLAVKPKSFCRMAIIGPPGSGKTYTALSLAAHLGDRVALVDSEFDRSLKYARDFTFFQVGLTDCHPAEYIEAIHRAVEEGFQSVVVDSMSHAWNGRSGVLSLVDKATRVGERSSPQDAWREVNPLQQELIETILRVPIHVICTLRTKIAYSQVQRVDPQTNTVRMMSERTGQQPIQREGIEYEFELTAEMDQSNSLTFIKSLHPKLQYKQYPLPGKELALSIKEWLDDGAPIDEEIKAREEEKRVLREEIKEKLPRARRDERQLTDYLFAMYGRSSLYSLEPGELEEVVGFLDERIAQAEKSQRTGSSGKSKESKSKVIIIDESEGHQQ